MIFGFNTDVKCAETVYHVQSEARQHELLLETQVFVGGRCIGKHATSYAEKKQEPEFSEEHMHDMLREQHKQIVAAVREGRIQAELTPHDHEEDLKVAAAASAEPVRAAPTATSAAVPFEVVAAPAILDEPATMVQPVVVPASSTQIEIKPPTARIPNLADATPLDELAAEFAAAVASKPVDPGLMLNPVGKVIGKGVSVECSTPAPAPDGNGIVVGVQIADESGPAACAQITCRISSDKAAARYAYAITGPAGVADLHITLNGLDPASISLLIQASYRGRSASRKYQLTRS